MRRFSNTNIIFLTKAAISKTASTLRFDETIRSLAFWSLAVKRISPATVTFGVMAIVLGLVALYVVRQALHQPPVIARPVPVKAPETVPVVFALNVIPKHTRLTNRDVFVSQVPKGTKLPSGAFRGVNLVEGRITKETIAPGKPLHDGLLLGLDESLPDLADRLPSGHRAVTIAVQGADTGGKKLAEGDHIDIALTVEGSHPDLGEVTTRTLMKNVLIVDAEATGPLVRTQRTVQPTTSIVTVAVQPVDANRLIVAQKSGTLHATLVSAADVEAASRTTDDAVNRRQLLGLKEVVPPKKFVIEKWTGSSVQHIEMSDDRIRESRDVSASRQKATPTSAAPRNDELGLDAPSGIKVPEIYVSAVEVPVSVPADSK
jgi:pilus assembly protein CpaB